MLRLRIGFGSFGSTRMGQTNQGAFASSIPGCATLAANGKSFPAWVRLPMPRATRTDVLPCKCNRNVRPTTKPRSDMQEHQRRRSFRSPMSLPIPTANAEQPTIHNPWVLCNRALTVLYGCLWRIDTVEEKRSDPRSAQRPRTQTPDSLVENSPKVDRIRSDQDSWESYAATGV